MVILPEWEMRMRSWVNGFSSSYERICEMATDFQGAQTAIRSVLRDFAARVA
jgi:hypothetical protein